MKKLVSILILNLIFAGTLAQGQILTSGLNQLAGHSANSTTTIGAIANRTTSEQLYQQALADEKAAWSSFPPNVGLLSKALKESQDGVKADDQSHSMAQEAMHSTATGVTADAGYNASTYNAMGSDDINKMINSSSQNWPQVSSKLKGYGMSLTEDKQYMQTPFGKFPTDATPEQMAQSIKNIASKFGVSSAEVDKGIAQAQATAEAISQKAYADAQNKVLGKMSAVADNKDGKGKDGDGTGKDDDKDKDKRKVAGEKDLVHSEGKDVDWDEKARNVNAYRDRLQEQMGVEPIWGKDDDIFKKIHEHYVQLDQQKIFIGEPANSKIATNP